MPLGRPLFVDLRELLSGFLKPLAFCFERFVRGARLRFELGDIHFRLADPHDEYLTLVRLEPSRFWFWRQKTSNRDAQCLGDRHRIAQRHAELAGLNLAEPLLALADV